MIVMDVTMTDIDDEMAIMADTIFAIDEMINAIDMNTIHIMHSFRTSCNTVDMAQYLYK
jgi:hypothetical protein